MKQPPRVFNRDQLIYLCIMADYKIDDLYGKKKLSYDEKYYFYSDYSTEELLSMIIDDLVASH